MILSSLACLVLTPIFHSLCRLTRDLQMNETKVAFMIDRLQGWNSGGGQWEQAATYRESISPEACVPDKGRPLAEASSALCAQPWLHLTAL